MTTVAMKSPAPGGLSNKARELMAAINVEAGKQNVRDATNTEKSQT